MSLLYNINNVYNFFLDIDDCGNNSCLNGATCHDLINSYECICVQGYNGTFCEAGYYINFILSDLLKIMHYNKINSYLNC